MINIYKQKFTPLQQEILRLLFSKIGIKLNQRQIANFLEVSAPAITKAIPKLEEERLINVEQDIDTKRWAIEINTENQKAVQLKRVDNLKFIFETGLAYFLEEHFAGGTVILFGSYSRGEDIFNSDIDIAVIGRKRKEIDLKKFEKMFGREIIINFYSSFKSIHRNLLNNILNGIVLSGSVNL